MQETGRARMRLVWLLLVVCTVAGLAAMHSLGHQALMHSHDHGHPAHEADVNLIGLGPGTGHAPGGVCDAGCAHPVAQQAPASGHDHLMDLCFAMVGGVLLLLLRRAASGSLGVVVLRRRPGTVSASSRAPPQPRLGLTLATVAVLRT